MKALTFSDIREIITIDTDFRLWYEDVGKAVDLSVSGLQDLQFVPLDEVKPPRLQEYHNHKYPLYSRVESLDKLALQELCALMWIGRGDSFPASDWQDAVEYARTTNIGYIISKFPLVEYLTDGLKEMGYLSEYSEYCIQFSNRQREYKNLIEVADFTRELYEYLGKHPNMLHEFSPRRFEQLVADILKNSGYEVHLTQETRDGGRDILAVYSTPMAQLMTIVECKKYAQNKKIGIETVERFLYVVDRKDDASMGMIVTTSSFTKGARDIEMARPYRLSLKDFEDIQGWLDIAGRKYEKNGSGIWLPNVA